MQKGGGGGQRTVLKALSVGAQEAPGSLHHPSICHTAKVGQNYLDSSCPLGVPFSRFWVVDEGDGAQGGRGAIV